MQAYVSRCRGGIENDTAGAELHIHRAGRCKTRELREIKSSERERYEVLEIYGEQVERLIEKK